MRSGKIHFSEGVTLVGGAAFTPNTLEAALSRAPQIVCADGGANSLSGRSPAAIIGDLDSIEDAEGWRARLGDRLIGVDGQDDTDFDKCLARIDAPFVIGVGFLGGRIDHELAALSALIADDRRIILLGEDDVVVSAGCEIAFNAGVDDRVSIFPMKPVTVLETQGLVWPAIGLRLEPGGRVGTSNRAAADRVVMRFDAAGAILITGRGRLDDMISACVGGG